MGHGRRTKLVSALAVLSLIGGSVLISQAQDAAAPQMLVGHTDPVYAVEFTPDGSQIVTGSFDKSIRLWDAATKKTLRVFNGHTGLVLTVDVAPDGRRIASGGLDNTVKVWDIPMPPAEGAAPAETADPPVTAQPTLNLAGHKSQVYGVAFNHDGKVLASASNDKTIKLWDLANGKELRTLPEQGGPVYAVAFSHDGTLVASGGGDKTVRLYNAETGAEVRQLAGAEGAVYSVAFHPQGQLAAAAGLDKKIRLWNVADGSASHVFAGHTDDIYRVQFNPAGTRLMSIGYSGTVYVWDAGNPAKPLFTTKLPVVLYSGAYAPDGKSIAATANDGKTYLVALPAEAL